MGFFFHRFWDLGLELFQQNLGFGIGAFPAAFGIQDLNFPHTIWDLEGVLRDRGFGVRDQISYRIWDLGSPVLAIFP